MQVLSVTDAIIILGLFALGCFVLTEWHARRNTVNSKEGYLVALRRVHWLPAALSIASAWVWAPALFVAAQQAYNHGWVGVFWFTVPNVACLIVFAFFADRARRRYPDGFTLSGAMRDTYSRRVAVIYGTALSLLAACSFAVQLLAGGLVVAGISGLDYTSVTIAMAVTAILYSLHGGLGSSVVMGWVKMALIALVGFVLAPWAVSQAGLSTLTDGLAGSSGEYTSLIAGAGTAVFWSFGLSTTIGLMSGPFGDQVFWQRAWSVRPQHVKKAFIAGAIIFATVPLTMSSLGFIAAGAGLDIADTQLTNLAAILEWLPAWTAIPFLIFLLSGLTSTLDSNLSAISSIAGHDIERALTVDPVKAARISMVILGLAGLAIANVPGIAVVQLFIIYGTLRASTLIPTVLTLSGTRLSERGVFYGVLAALIVGIPMSAYGNLTGNVPWIVGGSIAVLALSGGVAIAVTHLAPQAVEEPEPETSMTS